MYRCNLGLSNQAYVFDSGDHDGQRPSFTDHGICCAVNMNQFFPRPEPRLAQESLKGTIQISLTISDPVSCVSLQQNKCNNSEVVLGECTSTIFQIYQWHVTAIVT